jgi:lysophospholipase L1-like esterase
MLQRFDRDVAEHRPTLIVIMTQNDYWPGSKIELARSEANIRQMIERGLALGAEVRLATPPPVTPEVGSFAGAAEQRALEPDYIDMQRRLVLEYRLKPADVHRVFNGRARQLLGDPWHPNADGQAVIADTIMDAN